MSIRRNKMKLPSNRIFGFFFGIVFLILGFFFYEKKIISYFFLFLSIVFIFLGFLNSKKLKLFNFLWIKLGLTLGAIIAPIAIGFVYYFLISPISLLMRLVGQDPLKIKNKKKVKSYWIKRSSKINTMKEPF